MSAYARDGPRLNFENRKRELRMDDGYIWSESALEPLISSIHPDVRSWALSTLLRLYPTSCGPRMEQWLDGSDTAQARTVLRRLLESSRPDPKLIPPLKTLFLTGEPDISSLAIRLAGAWNVPDAASWIQEKIFQNRSLSPDQIEAMIGTLGVTPGPNAYELLKATEASMAEKRSSLWMTYYDALLSHRKREDIDTLVRLFTDRQQDESRRRNAMQVLAHKADPVLNPSDLLFGHVEGVQKHLAARMGLVLAATGQRTDRQHIEGFLAELRPYLDVFRPENVSVAIEHLKVAADKLNGANGFYRDVILSTLEGQKRCKVGSDESYALAALGLCSFITGRIEEEFPVPAEDAPWEQRRRFVLTERFVRSIEPALLESVVRDAPDSRLKEELIDTLQTASFSWKTFQAVEMLGLMGAPDGSEAIVKAIERFREDSFFEVAERALKRIGLQSVPAVARLLDSTAAPERALALRVLAAHPTRGGVEEILKRFSGLLDQDPASLCETLEDMGAEDFLALLEKEYRPGEWRTARVILRLCRIHGRTVASMKEIEREVEEHERLWQRQQALFTPGFRDWPDRVDLDLACRRCGKRYTYAVKEVHLHPHQKSEVDPEAPEAAPYRHGIVICDDLRCKNCQALNDFAVTRQTLAQITAESLKLVALHRSKVSPPPYYPVKHVDLSKPGEKSLSLVELERENSEAAQRNATQPQAHLVLGKFYEYVKDFPRARRAFLKALDLDPRALEAMAGLARLDHSEGRVSEAYEWIDRCYRHLSEGRLYTAKDSQQFKKAVREKRRGLARSLGIHPEEPPVKVRFQIESTEYPKNRPCPCGSGKKFKLCCMVKPQEPPKNA